MGMVQLSPAVIDWVVGSQGWNLRFVQATLPVEFCWRSRLEIEIALLSQCHNIENVLWR